MSVSQQRKGREGELELVRVLRDNGLPARAGVAVSYGMEPDVVGVPLEKVHVIACQDTDVTPFGTGAYACTRLA